MKIQQLRYLSEVARRDLSVSAAAEALFTSQPGISRQIKALEDELGIEIFVRHGKRLTALTEPGRAVLAIAERILAEAANLKRAGEEFIGHSVDYGLLAEKIDDIALFVLPSPSGAARRYWCEKRWHELARLRAAAWGS